MMSLGLGTSSQSQTITSPAFPNNNYANWANAKSQRNCICSRSRTTNPTTKTKAKAAASLSILMMTTPSSNSNYPLASRIIVTNLGYSISESSLHKEFSCFGQVAEVKLVKDETPKRSKAYAFIQYTHQDDAILALENMDGKIFDGRLIFVELAKPQKNSVRQYPIASGPPKKQPLQHPEEVADCWY